MSDKEKTGCEYASVYIIDNPYAIDAAYDYYIPLELRGALTRGSFVTVPFGKGNRRLLGVVAELLPSTLAKGVKPISAVCEDKIPLSDEMLALCFYLKEQVLCTVGDAVRCALGSAVLGKLSEYFYPTVATSPVAVGDLSLSDIFVYEYICSHSYAGREAIRAAFGADADNVLKKLIDRGYIEKGYRTDRTGEATVSIYSLALDSLECEDILGGKGKIKLSSQKHKDILRLVCDADRELTADDIIRECSASRAQIKALVDKGILKKTLKRVYREPFSVNAGERGEIILNDCQQNAYEEIRNSLDSGRAGAILLHGITGSGKTSVMIKAIEHATERGRGVIVLLPEIALTPQTLEIFCTYFGTKLALIHSGLSLGERLDAYSKIASGEATVVVGTRSAIFAPVKNLGFVIIDEEHESTYKSESSPKYHARDVARFRCAYNNATLLLSSATPSIESYTKAKEGKYKLVKLDKRYGGATLPKVAIHDMRRETAGGNTSPIGSLLLSKLKETTDRGEQAILFLNRRGYNTMISCRSCGESITCPHCSISMNYHTEKSSYDRGFLFCHWCGTKIKVPQKCPSCSSEHLHKMGFGTQKIQQELELLLPGKRILRMDADSTAKKSSHEELITAFKNHEYDVLLGTQMVTKGHDFPKVTLVGVLLADMSLYLDDYHANERTFAMLTQVIGRAGRAASVDGEGGFAVIQTNNPDNDIIKRACSQDYESFYESEIKLRKLLVFPPYCDIALLTVSSPDESQTILGAKKLREMIEQRISGEFSDVQIVIFGPFEAPVYKVEEKYRMRMVIKCRLNKRSRAMFSDILKVFGKEISSKLSISVDFNPTGL